MKPGATGRQKQRRRQRGYRGHGERARVQKGAVKTVVIALSYASVTRTPPLPPQTRPLKRVRRPREESNVSHTLRTKASIKAEIAH